VRGAGRRRSVRGRQVYRNLHHARRRLRCALPASIDVDCTRVDEGTFAVRRDSIVLRARTGMRTGAVNVWAAPSWRGAWRMDGSLVLDDGTEWSVR
jgi:hypothetical protein